LIAGLGLALLLAWLSFGLIPRRGKETRAERWRAFCFRLGAMGLVGFALSDPVREAKSERLCIVYLQDVSDSVSDAEILSGRAFGARVKGLLSSGDSYVTRYFAERSLAENQGESLVSLRQRAGSHETALGPAIRAAWQEQPGNCTPRILLGTDGRETSGHVELVQGELARWGLHLPPIFPLRRAAAPFADVGIQSATQPDPLRSGEPFSLQVVLQSTSSGPAQLEFRETKSGRTGVQKLDLRPGLNLVRLEHPGLPEGEHDVALAVTHAGADAFPVNNQLLTSISAEGAPKVALVETEAVGGAELAGLLKAQGFAVEKVRPSEIGPLLVRSNAPRLVIGRDLIARDLSIASFARLRTWIEEGGAFFYVAGERNAESGELGGPGLEGLLPFQATSRELTETPGVALVLVLDRSGSMAGLPLEKAKQACLASLEALLPTDRLEIITFDSEPSVVVPMQRVLGRGRIAAEIARIRAGGGTAITPGLELAFRDLAPVVARRKHVILLTDGNSDSDGMLELVSSAAASGISTTTIGFGTGVAEGLLQRIAETGGGRYHAVVSADDLPRVFVHETMLLGSEEPDLAAHWITQVGKASLLRDIRPETAPPLASALQLRWASGAQRLWALDDGSPLLGLRRVGLGHVVGWGSDLSGHWSGEFLGWSQLGTFLGQLVRGLTVERVAWPLSVQKSGGKFHFGLDLNPDQQTAHGKVEATVWLENERGERSSKVVLEPRAPASQGGEIESGLGGALRARALYRDAAGELIGESRVILPASAGHEWASKAPDMDLLARLAQQSGGRWVDRPEDVAARPAPRPEKVHYRAELLAGAALLLAADLLLRRLTHRSWANQRN
jgi:Ca-activated chloride channel homolog